MTNEENIKALEKKITMLERKNSTLEQKITTLEQKITTLEQKIKTLQLSYAGVLADSTARYGAEGILDKITGQKRAEQMKNCADLAARFGVTGPKQAFEKPMEIFGCANWGFTDTGSGFEAVATNCILCAISKKMGAFSPCQIYCLSPIEASIKGVCPDAEFNTISTLWNSEKCKVNVKYADN